jgi:release factor glutamine methyltransferase
MKRAEAEAWLRDNLSATSGADEATPMASMVMEHLTGLSRHERNTQPDLPLDVHQLHHLTEITQRLTKHEPIQYVLGYAWFAGLKLYVDPSVLIPRPETEELVNWILNDVRKLNEEVFHPGPLEADKTNELKIMDVGTGSGCIALALKKAMPVAEVWGCDVSEKALNIARRNASETNIRVDFQGVDFLELTQQRMLPTVDIIVSNPPYIPLKQQGELASNVVNHEPHQALFVPDDEPLQFYHGLARYGQARLYENGQIYAEIHENAGPDVVKLFTNAGFRDVQLRKDMQGKDRMIRATAPNRY